MGAVVSGLAMGGVMGLIDLITNTGSLLLTRRSDNVFPSLFKKSNKKRPAKRKKIRVPKRNRTVPISISYDFLHDLTEYGDYAYGDEDFDDFDYNDNNLEYYYDDDEYYNDDYNYYNTKEDDYDLPFKYQAKNYSKNYEIYTPTASQKLYNNNQYQPASYDAPPRRSTPTPSFASNHNPYRNHRYYKKPSQPSETVDPNYLSK